MDYKFVVALIAILSLFGCPFTSLATAANQCSLEFNGTTSVTCNIRTIDKSGLDLLAADGTSRLDIKCNDVFLFESQLPQNVFARLQTLEELSIESCKLLQLPNNAFEGLSATKVLKVRTKNSEWGLGKSLELFPDSLIGLKQLTALHLKNLGFTNMVCNGGSELQVLDLSYNELKTIPENWGVSRFRRLQHLNLQNNNITELHAESFAGLSSLRVINVSNNHLETLPIGLFAGSKELREIHLQHNELYELPKGLFHRLEQLLVLDLSSNQLTSHHVDNTTFAGLIRLIVLNLANNALTRIDYRTFKELYFLQILNLRNNSIGHIEDNAFLPLYNLHTLNLAENRLHTLDDKLFNGLYVLSKLTLNNNLISVIEGSVFKNCSDLKELDLSSNQLTDVPEAIQDLAMLRTLDLGENQISTFTNGSFRNLHQLTGLRLIDNRIGNITVGMFWDLPRLSVLNLAKNRIQSIERGSFDRMWKSKQFDWIEISCQILMPNTFVHKGNLARVDLYANALNQLQLQLLRIAKIDEEQPQPEFYLGGNPFQCDCSMEWLQRINNMTTGHYPKVMDLQNIECMMPHARGSPQRPLTSLKSKDFLCRYEAHCFALCHCCDFDACDCEMTCPSNCTCYHDQTWGTNVVDCGGYQTSNLPKRVPMDSTIVYLDGNMFPILDNHAFIGRKNLRELYVNNSGVTSIKPKTFSGLTSLAILHLEDNKLKVLRLDGNKLHSIPIWQMQLSQFKTNIKSLYLGGNEWSCRCKFLQELTTFVADNALIIQDSQDIYCMDAVTGKKELDFNATSACSDYYAGGSVLQNGIPKTYLPLLAVALIFIFLFVILIVIFVFREPLRIWLFAHYGVRVFGPRCEESEKLYDAVLLHSAKDTEFVMQCLITELEAGRPPLRICLQHRDLSHEATHFQVLEAARVSRRVIILLTRNFLQTEWSRCELRRAVHDALRGRPHKLVIIEEPDVCLEAEMDVELVPYLKTSGVNRIRRNDRHFWEKLRYALPVDFPYRGNNYTIDHMTHEPPPPAYCPDGEDPNYSSATTATPSPRPSRRAVELLQAQFPQMSHHPNPHYQQSGHVRPPSEHIYSSIDSDYSTLDNENVMMMPQQQAAVNSLHRSMHQHQQQPQYNPHHTWRPAPSQDMQLQKQQQQQHHQQQQQQTPQQTTPQEVVPGQQGPHVQAYLV
uniref:TIR domain-containing protein n=1 Tax=Megaselia scalaris TaxID=36166 RepID=T1GEJ0_MEGSC